MKLLWLIAAIACLPARTAAAEDIEFTAAFDGSSQRYVQVLPQDFDPQQQVDVLVALHGHGSDRWQFIRQPRDECRAVRDVARERGLLLVSPDYRAATSWMGPAAEADMLQILKRLKNEFRVRRVILCGGSMGGASCLTFAARHPAEVHGVVSMNGTANHIEFNRFQDAIAASFGGAKTEIPGEYRRRSAELWAHRLTMPVALTVGGKDTTVPPASVQRLADQVRRAGRPVRLIHRPDGGHVTTYDDAADALRFVLDQAGRDAAETVAASDTDAVPISNGRYDPRLVLPDALYAVAGQPVSVYLDNLVLCRDSDSLRFDIACDIGRLEERRWTHVPTLADAGKHAFSVTVSDADGQTLAEAQTLLHVSSVPSGQDREIALLLVGDSLTHATIYPNQLAKRLQQANLRWTMLGTHRPDRAIAGVVHEGYGGWTWQRFATMFEPHPDGTHRKRSSPFVFVDDGAETPRLNVKRYFVTATEGQRPDVVYFLLGINDCFSANADDDGAIDRRIDAMLSHAETLLTAFRSAAPAADLAVCVTTPPNARKASFEANYKGRYPRWGWKRIQHRLVERLLTHFAWEPQPVNPDRGRIHIVPTHLDLDPRDGYPDNNAVHPNEIGYQQIANSLYGWLTWRLSQPDRP